MRTRIIHTSFWEDAFVGDLSRAEKLLFIYLLTNNKIGLSGAYELPLKRICVDTDLSRAEVEAGIAKLVEAGKIAYVNDWIFIKNVEKYNAYTGEKNEVAKRRELKLAPPELFSDTLSIPYRYQDDSPRNKKSEIRNKKSEDITMSDENRRLWEYWESQLAPITKNQIFHRNALNRLREAHGTDLVQKLIRIAAIAHTDTFAKGKLKVENFKQLEDQWDALILYAKGKITNQPKNFSTK